MVKVAYQLFTMQTNLNNSNLQFSNSNWWSVSNVVIIWFGKNSSHHKHHQTNYYTCRIDTKILSKNIGKERADLQAFSSWLLGVFGLWSLCQALLGDKDGWLNTKGVKAGTPSGQLLQRFSVCFLYFFGSLILLSGDWDRFS